MTHEKAKSYLLGIAEGEKGALLGFVSTVSGRVRYIADGILHDSSLADDVLSIVIERVWQKAPLLARLKNPLGYINTIAYNSAIDLLRRRKELPLRESAASAAFADASAEKLDVLRALEKLDAEERTVLLCIASAGYSLSECARLTGMTKKMCFTRYRRAKQKFKKFYGEAER